MLIKRCPLCNGETEQEDFNSYIEYSCVDCGNTFGALTIGDGEICLGTGSNLWQDCSSNKVEQADCPLQQNK